MKLRVLLLPGDGIGPEIAAAARGVIELCARKAGHDIAWSEGLIGYAAFDRHGDTMPEATWKQLAACDAVLFGAVGLPERDRATPPEMRPEKRALLPMRQRMGLAVNIRPVRVYPGLEALSPLKDDIARGVNLTFYRELTGDMYFGRRERSADGQRAADECAYTRAEIARIARSAFAHAGAARLKVTSVDKANVLGAVGLFWREVVEDVQRREFPGVELEHCLVDAFNLYLFTRPASFRIVLTSNMFGDILSDGAAGIAGSLGLLPSASLNPDNGFSLYEPSGGSAPDIAGQGVANPLAMILSGALMLRHAFRDEAAAARLELAVERALAAGARTGDLLRGAPPAGARRLGTQGMADAVAAFL